MDTKQKLLSDINQALNSGLITPADLQSITGGPSQPQTATLAASHTKSRKASAIEIMFAIGGVLLYLTIAAVLITNWRTTDLLTHILLSAGLGVAMWAIAYYFIKQPEPTENTRGLANAMVITGSLLLVTGGQIVAAEYITSVESLTFIVIAIDALLLGALHIAYDKLIKRDLLLQFGIILAVASVPFALFYFLYNAHAWGDFWCLAVALSSLLVAYIPRLIAKYQPDRAHIATSLDSIAIFVALAAVYAASFAKLEVLWLLALIGAVLYIFYLSVTNRNKGLLGSASFFLILSIVTIAFRYFAGFGVPVAFAISTVGIIGVTIVASNIRKKYF